MAKKTTSPPPREPLRLVVAHTEAEEKIETRIGRGYDLLTQEIRNEQELEETKRDYKKWNDYNAEMLRQLFNTTEVSDEYTYYGPRVFFAGRERYLSEEVKDFRENVQGKVTRLESILGRIELIPVAPGVPERHDAIAAPVEISNRVFVVHGHDQHMREATARLLSQLDLEPIILNEQPNAGRTLIEKFETYADVGFAVVLLTADDVGAALAEKDDLEPRARQNVIFELGFFVGKLGRRKVCALYQRGVEILSDFQGVAYVPIDEAGAWRYQLAKELKQAGLNVDMNKVG